MKKTDQFRFTLSATAFVLVLTVFSGITLSQSAEGRSRNNPYSPSPNGKSTTGSASTSSKSDGSVSFVMRPSSQSQKPVESEPSRPSIAQATFKIAKTADAKTLSPTEIYKIGVGDVLFIGLSNAVQGSGYFTVRPDGSIDYPLAGENVRVAGQTVDVVEEMLASSITLFKDPQIEVKVRQYGSHQITVSGLVENAGMKYLQREAIPLFAVRAEAVVSSKATRVSIRRGESVDAEILSLGDPKTENTLIFPGDHVNFVGDENTSSQAESYFIGGEIASGGQKPLSYGLTLYQAIVAAGGAKGDPKKAVIRRKNEKGLFNIQEHDLRKIKNGRSMDPILAPGDVIEIGN